MTFGLIKDQIEWLRSGTYSSQIAGWEVEVKYFSDMDGEETYQINVMYKSGNDGKMYLASSILADTKFICGKFEEVILQLQKDYGV